MDETIDQIKTPMIYEAISNVMGEIDAVTKDRKNEQQGYKFRGIDDVMNAVHGPLAKHKVFYLPKVLSREVVERQTRSGGTLFYTILTMEYTFYTTDGSSVTALVVGEAMDSADKSTNKAMSAALKYALLQIFCIPTQDQSDADSQTPDVAPGLQSAVFNGPQVSKIRQAEKKPTPVPTMSEGERRVREKIKSMGLSLNNDQQGAIRRMVSAMNDGKERIETIFEWLEEQSNRG